MYAATTQLYTLSLHDALPIFRVLKIGWLITFAVRSDGGDVTIPPVRVLKKEEDEARSEEHTSELQSRPHLVCRLLLEKKKNLSFSPQHALPLLRTAPPHRTHR